MDDMAYIFNGNLDCITFVTTGLNKQRFLTSKRQFLVEKPNSQLSTRFCLSRLTPDLDRHAHSEMNFRTHLYEKHRSSLVW